MSKGTTIKDALQKWEEKAGIKAPDALEVQKFLKLTITLTD